ncbi:hypothetical protein MKZ38_000508 [Zalerion maritima]|uniref:RNA-directed DNA polymerase n=1 Tax=Zalerion maritima TaxID=339359 RepID=A0AAD5WN32_9PEZI|nr:hypothetical protein MKZ38_000508 [Zalerion maritima]
MFDLIELIWENEFLHAKETPLGEPIQKKTLVTINRAPGNGKPQGQTEYKSPEQGPGTPDTKPILRTIALVGRDEYPTKEEEGEHEQALKHLAGAKDAEPSGEVCGSERSIARMVAATKPPTTDHLHVTVEINGKFAKALLDSGAQGDYVSPEFIRHHGLELRTKRNPYTVQNIEGDPMTFNNGTVNQETAQLPIYVNGKETPTIFDVLDTGSRDFEAALEEYLEENLRNGYIRPSTSPAGYPILFVPKKNGRLRLCVDYRQLNDITIKNRYPLPLISDLRDKLHGAQIFTTLDLKGAYNLIRIAEGEEWKTAFRTKRGLFEYLVLETLEDAQLLVEPGKAKWHAQEVKYLGYYISPGKIGMDPKKVRAIRDWPRPQNVKDVRSVLGFMNFYRQFVKGYSQVATPLTQLTKKDQAFEWKEPQQQAFNQLKELILQEPILTIPDLKTSFEAETDASEFALGGQLGQRDEEGRLRPVAFYSKKLNVPELNYQIHDKELMAIIEAFREWKHYLTGTKHPVKVYTDHKNLTNFTTTKALDKRQTRWAEFLSEFNFTIIYRKGHEVSTVARDETRLIKEVHEAKAHGHQGVWKTYQRLRQHHQFQGTRAQVEQVIRNCDLCKKSKAPRHKPYGELRPLQIPDAPWHSVSLDFVTGLPPSTEPLTQTIYSYFIPFVKNGNTLQLVYVFIRNIVANHGMPRELISDRDKLFTSHFWQALAARLGVRHRLSTAFHPQTDGQTERTNQTLEQYLRCYVNYPQNDRVQLLPLAQFAYNSAFNESTKKTPMYANYGYTPTIGPFKVKRKISDTNYELSLPRSMQIHPIFHILLLEPAPSRAQLDKTTELENEEEYEVEKILAHRGEGPQTEYLVKWKGCDDDENTWEPIEHLTNAQASDREPPQQHKGHQRSVSTAPLIG